MTDKVCITCAVYNESTGLYQLTPFWRDFVNKSIREDRDSDQILAEFNATQWDYGTREWQVLFNTSEDLMNFIVRWS